MTDDNKIIINSLYITNLPPNLTSLEKTCMEEIFSETAKFISFTWEDHLNRAFVVFGTEQEFLKAQQLEYFEYNNCLCKIEFGECRSLVPPHNRLELPIQEHLFLISVFFY